MKGQVTIIALLMTFASLVILAGLMAPTVTAVNYGIGNSSGFILVNAVFGLWMPWLMAAVLIGFLYYSFAMRG